VIAFIPGVNVWHRIMLNISIAGRRWLSRPCSGCWWGGCERVLWRVL